MELFPSQLATLISAEDQATRTVMVQGKLKEYNKSLRLCAIQPSETQPFIWFFNKAACSGCVDVAGNNHSQSHGTSSFEDLKCGKWGRSGEFNCGNGQVATKDVYSQSGSVDEWPNNACSNILKIIIDRLMCPTAQARIGTSQVKPSRVVTKITSV
ncbi:Uncharacterized protein Fot_30864 [Forsythia ovata]|uniref:Uncharacterized protein n=1 Tax=Forsythia ovata TaxID=205694 RepID=A0ABD1T3C9_9LAMI